MKRSKLLLLLVLLAAICASSAAQPADCNTTDGSGAEDDTCGIGSSCNGVQCNCDSGYFTISGTHTDCQEEYEPDVQCQEFQDDCVYCGMMYEGPCRKCVNVIYNGQCLQACPDGATQQSTYLANISLTISTCQGVGLADIPSWAIVIMIVLGGVVLIITAILITSIACTFLRRSTVGQFDIRAKETAVQEAELAEQQAQPKSILSSSTNRHGSSAQKRRSVEETDHAMEEYFGSRQSLNDAHNDNADLEEFLTRLERFRPEAELFLKMLNDMRRRLKELPQNSPAAQQYRNVIRDLTRLLYLLNKDPKRMALPADGNRLLDWSDSILNRYLQAQGQPASQPQSQSQPQSYSSAPLSAARSTAPSNSNSYRSAARSLPSNPANDGHRSSGRISFIGDQVETGF